MSDLSIIDALKTDITLITSTSYIECDKIPILELYEFRERAVKIYNKMNGEKGGAT